MSISVLVDMYGFRTVFNPELGLIVLIAALVYWKYKGEEVSRRGIVCFMSGLLVLYFALGGPLNLLGHFWFSLHMLQQSFLYLVVPPLLFAGLPGRFYDAVQRYSVSRAIMGFIGHPIIALFLFNGAFSFYHIPFLFEAAKSDYTFHTVLHALLFAAAFGLWWPVFSPVGKKPLSSIQKIGYIFLNGLMLTPACALIIFAREPLYGIYTGDVRLLCLPFYSVTASKPAFDIGWLTQLADQQLGGVVMKIMQEIAYGTVLGHVFFRWYRKERADEPEDELAPGALPYSRG
ncbi:hypothetical protein PAESOLCIP111_03117 [Paenibacillus solanacearum]|uniref:Cytochrome c oxidase assembly factor CtaG n=1 Tax=Paenibacillus solanacearum TaxID=2048548 RepID=A0A916K5L6_9BACL|nr:cytochrome c oxidase assembly protein [Paenibacillus solanacearum]CAG7629580.1 hypothetical protein PAESOLCIP111_03117 [Paenibacillus solanacearum]